MNIKSIIKTINEKINYVKTRNKLVKKFINSKYDLDVNIYEIDEIVYKSFDGSTKTKAIEDLVEWKYYSPIFEDGYYYTYNLLPVMKGSNQEYPQRYTVEELRKIISKKLDSAERYEFDDSYLAHIAKKVILKIYI